MSQHSDITIIEKHIAQLMEHFESVQIIATKIEGDETIAASKGDGNWYARVGSVRDWLAQQDERTREQVKRERDS